MTTTNGKWNVANRFTVVVEGSAQGICIASGENDREAEANAHLIALAGNLAQKYDISKLEAATEQLRHTWENAGASNVVIAVEDFLTAITRQPAGEKPQQ